MILDEFISAIFQLVLFSIIPFIVFVISKKQLKGFLKYVGLFKPLRKTTILAIVTAIIMIIGGVVIPLLSPEVKELMRMKGTVVGNLTVLGLSYSSLVILAIIALIKTSLSEEILFRGFIAKRLITWLGFKVGNSIQAALFGLLHIGLLILIANPQPLFLISVFVFSGTAGFILGYIKEILGNGSIIPGWIAHGLANLVSFFILAFVI